MKKSALFSDVSFAENANDMVKLNVPRGGTNGFPNADFGVFPLIGQLTFKINGNTFNPTGIACGYMNKSDVFEIRMVSVNSFGREGRENADDEKSSVRLIEGAPVTFGSKPSEIVSEMNKKIVSIKDNETKLYFPTLAAGEPADWEKPILRTVTTRQVNDNNTEYETLKKSFVAYVTENNLVDCVKAVDKDFLPTE
jgi:hypothetical protein